ncbi:hypothetical protein NL317_31255, partial [Klebsiella pneumoniae]|nr:hypothetical protein [Klebsiella pneumoniae]
QFVRNNCEQFKWIPEQGLKKVSGGLSVSAKRRIGEVLRELGIYMNQPLIYEEADDLLSAN